VSQKFSPAAFLEACGASEPVSLQVRSAGTPASACIRLAQPFAVIGRSKRNHLVLEHFETSRRHVYLQMLAGSVFCIDLESTTGIHWPDGQRPAGWLAHGQALRLGGHELRLLDSSLASTPCPDFDPMAPGCLQGPHLALEFLNGSSPHSQWTMNRALVLLGNSRVCKVRFHDAHVAAVHGSLVWTPAGTWIVDLRGRAGIYVNGQKIRCARLDDGDRIRVADFEIRAHCPSEPPTFPAWPVRPTQKALVANGSHAPRSSFLVPSSVAGPLTRSPQGLLALGDVPDKGAPLTRSPQSLLDLGDVPDKGALESILLPLAQQFSVMQNQMFDQFQQAMMMMFQMFGNLQKDQMALIRQELDRVQELTQEIQILQAELKKSHPSHPIHAVEPPALATTPFKPESNRKAPTTTAPSVPADVTRSTTPSSSVSAGTQDPLEVHAWLCRRMAELQEDRRSRLQKILGFISGK
jgi:pSer/pThr/pTyr-binding forkhead associated (FHA) protein